MQENTRENEYEATQEEVDVEKVGVQGPVRGEFVE